jgi:hypothetical protein
MSDEETDEESRDIRTELVELLGRRFARPGREEDDELTPAQKEIYETVGGLAAAMGRLEDPSPPRGTFPTRGKTPSYRDKDPVEPRRVRPGDAVTIRGTDLYGIRDVRVGGRRARIVRRGFGEAQILIPHDARDGTVWVNGQSVDALELDLVDDDSDNYGTVT